MIRVALTHDVDRVKKTYQYLTHSIKAVKNLKFDDLLYNIKSLWGKEPYWQFPEIIRIEQEFGIKSTFFFLNETIKTNWLKPSKWHLSLGRYNFTDENVTQIIVWLDKNGWEIGLHGSYNSFNNQSLLEKEKWELENILGHKILGVRQHWLNLCSDTWSIQKFVGFNYDTSWGSNVNLGYKENKIAPFHPFNDYFTVFPLVIMDQHIQNYTKPWDDVKRLIEITSEKNGILVINWHNRMFNDLEFLGLKDFYINLVELLKKYNSKFGTLAEFYNVDYGSK